jgi:hypothetical protein
MDYDLLLSVFERLQCGQQPITMGQAAQEGSRPATRCVTGLPLPAKYELTFFIILKHWCPAFTPRTLIRDLMPTSRPGRRGRGGCRRPPDPTRHGSNVFIVVYRALESRAVGVS